MKSKKGAITIGIILGIFIAIIVSMVLITEIFTQQTIQTKKTSVSNELVTITNAYITGGPNINTTYPLSIANAQASTDWQYSSCPITDIVYGNATKNFTLTTDYTFDTASGVILLKNTAAVNTSGVSNATYIDYTFCQDGYAKDSGTRSIAGLIGLFAALALIGFLVGYALKDAFDF